MSDIKTPVPGGRYRNRWVTRAPVMVPFFSFGDTWRGDYYMPTRGWYVVSRTGILVGPFPTKVIAAEKVCHP